MSWISRMVNAFCPRRVDADLEEELRFHAEQRVGDLVRDGVSQDEAERMALRRLGSPLPLRESSHDVKSALWLESFLRDLRFGLRMLVRDRTSSLAAIASLALALGACTTAFALIDALILRTLPLPAPHRLIDIVHVMPAFFSPENKPHESGYFTYRDFELFRHTARDYADLFADGGLRPVLFDDAEGAGRLVRRVRPGGWPDQRATRTGVADSARASRAARSVATRVAPSPSMVARPTFRIVRWRAGSLSNADTESRISSSDTRAASPSDCPMPAASKADAESA